jgi:hypothetical protein
MGIAYQWVSFNRFPSDQCSSVCNGENLTNRLGLMVQSDVLMWGCWPYLWNISTTAGPFLLNSFVYWTTHIALQTCPQDQSEKMCQSPLARMARCTFIEHHCTSVWTIVLQEKKIELSPKVFILWMPSQVYFATAQICSKLISAEVTCCSEPNYHSAKPWIPHVTASSQYSEG